MRAIAEKPVFQTERFDVFCVTVHRSPALGEPRDLFTAWSRVEDMPRSVCEVVVHIGGIVPNYIEWIHVCETERRKGIATEVLRGLEKHIGEVTMDGATDAGDAFCDAYCVEAKP